MLFWWFILCCDLLIPIVMIVGGRLMWKTPPKSINGLMGYRTSQSMKNVDTWRFANSYCGKLWWRIGWVILIPSIVVHLPVYYKSEDTIGIVSLIVVSIQCVILIYTIFPTEKALKKTFTEDGIRK